MDFIISNVSTLLRHFLIGTGMGFISLCMLACSPVVGRRSELMLRTLAILLLLGAALFPLFLTFPYLASIYLYTIGICLIGLALIALAKV